MYAAVVFLLVLGPFPEDMGKRKEDEVQKTIDTYMSKIDKMLEVKEKDIMTV